MRLLQLRDVESRSSDRVFRHAPVRALAIYLIGLGGVGWMFFYAFTRGWQIGYLFGSGVLLFLAWMLRIVTARFRPSNWLVRMCETGLYVQYRSYLNYQLPDDESSVVFLSYGEIASAWLVRERVKTPDPTGNGGTRTQTLRYVELELSGDTAPLAQALQSEQAEQAPLKERWYGKTSTLYHDYPVSMAAPPFLRIRWEVVPTAQKFLDALRPYTPIVEPVFVAQNFDHLETLTPEEQKQRLRELAQRGDVLSAIYTARRLYRCSLGEAKEMVEQLRRAREAG